MSQGSQLEPDWKVKRNKSCQLLGEEHSGLRSNKLREGMTDSPWFIPEIGGCQVPGMKYMKQDVRSEGSGNQAHLRPFKGLELYLKGCRKLLQRFEHESD